MPISKTYNPKPAFSELGAEFSDPVKPVEFTDITLRYFNQSAADDIGLGALTAQEQMQYFAKFQPLPDNLPTPLALRYHGHQFRSYNPQLGDGRGFLFTQLSDNNNRLLDLGTKGTGPTPWSRGGDGRLTLKGACREILATEMLEALGVNTSRTLCVFETDKQLWRNDEPSPARSAVLTRLSHTHIRFGTFQRLAHLGKADEMHALLAHIGEHYMPTLQTIPQALRPAAFLEIVVEMSAKLAAQWMAAGFVHGVLNTDNMNINGESFDYGPWRFLPSYDPKFTAAYFDTHGLYAYGRQPEAVSWNLARLGEALGTLAPIEELQAAHRSFSALWQIELPLAFLARLGLQPKEPAEDLEFIQIMFKTLGDTQLPFEGFLFDWFAVDEKRAMSRPNLTVYQSDDFKALRSLILTYQPDRPERLSHTYFARETPETLLIDEVEALWAPIAAGDNWEAFHQKIAGIRQVKQALNFT